MKMQMVATSYLLLSFLAYSSSLSIEINELQKKVLKNDGCWSKPLYTVTDKVNLLGQKEEPLAQSMDNFISLIEKIEENLRKKNRPPVAAEPMARALLTRFRIDGIKLNKYGIFDQIKEVEYQNGFEDTVLGFSSSTGPMFEFEEDLLEQGEKCSMFFMLSHFINHTAIPGETNTYRQSAPTYNRASMNSRFSSRRNEARFAAPTVMTNHPREYGVVSFRNNLNQAITLNKVLLGIIAGFSQNIRNSVEEIREELSKKFQVQIQRNQNSNLPNQPNSNIPRNGGIIDPVLSTTIVPTLAISAGVLPEGSESKAKKRLGAVGEWNSTLCTTTYRLKQKDGLSGTMAEIRGGIDGYNMGRLIAADTQAFQNMQLSQILRLYYSPYGFKPRTTEGGYCQRSLASGKLDQVLRSEATDYLSVFLPIKNKGQIVENLEGMVDNLYGEFTNYKRQATNIETEDSAWCQSSSQIGGNRADSNFPKETPKDVFFVIDRQADPTNIKQMAEIIQKVGLKLNMRKWGSSMTILFNTRNGTLSTKDLTRIAWNTTNRGCALCKFTFTDQFRSGGVAAQPEALIEGFNSTLRAFEEGKLSLPSVPSKTIVLFNYGTIKGPSSNRDKFNKAKRELKEHHRDTAILVVGSAGRDMEAFTDEYREQDTIKTDKDVASIADELHKKLDDNPAAFQYDMCAEKPSDNVEIVGYISPNTLQRWAFYPKYFLKSYRINLKFQVKSDTVDICMSRSPRPEEHEVNCRTAKGGEEAVDLPQTRNPCRGRTLYDCEPIYLSIIGKSQGSSQKLCTQDGCMNMEQIEFKLTHDGISCNSAILTRNSFTLQLILAALSIFTTFKMINKKY